MTTNASRHRVRLKYRSYIEMGSRLHLLSTQVRPKTDFRSFKAPPTLAPRAQSLRLLRIANKTCPRWRYFVLSPRLLLERVTWPIKNSGLVVDSARSGPNGIGMPASLGGHCTRLAIS